MERILLASDGSEEAGRAADFAARLSASWDIPVDVVHAIPPRHIPPDAPVEAYARLEHAYVSLREVLMASGRAVVEGAADRVREKGGTVGDEEVLIGDAARQIAEYAEMRDVSYIVMGRRGLSDLKGLLLGSVSHRVGQLSGKTLITTE